MQIIVYANQSSAQPYVNVIVPAEDDIPTIVARFLSPYSIPYAVIDDCCIPDGKYIGSAMTVSVTGESSAEFDWDLAKAKELAVQYNANYWQQQYDKGLLNLNINTDYQLNLAIATPEEQRTADQVAAVEFLAGINGLQTEKEEQIANAVNGEEIISILDTLG